MAQPIESRRVAEIMASWLSLSLVSCKELQSLWAGYGHICAITARATSDEAAAAVRQQCGSGGAGGDTFQLVLKVISPPHDHGDEGHLRKMLSYDVEQYFYSHVAPHLGADVAVARCLASTRAMAGRPDADELQGLTATLMTDLRTDFPVAGEKRSLLEPRQVYAALDWLGKFHATSWQLLPDALDRFLLPPLDEAKRRAATPDAAGDRVWLNGGYTYLATRRSEYASLARDHYTEWSDAFCTPLEGTSLSLAEAVAKFLTPSGRPVETYIHGDVKSENLFTTRAGGQVAFFDFQYVGLGLGVCDLSKLFTCSVPLHLLTRRPTIRLELPMDENETELLEHYREALLGRRPSDKGKLDYGWDEFVRHWETALVDWCRFQASWGFWGNTEWLEARVRSILKDQNWRDWLRQQVGEN